MNTVITESESCGECGQNASYDVFSKLINDRILFLYDHIDDRVATDIVAALLYMDHLDDKSKISIYINSEGGDIRSVFMIFDVMRLIKSPIQTICLGSATFAPVLLLAAGTKGMRYATKSSIVCLSQLFSDGVSYVDMTNAKITFEQIKKDNHQLISAMSKLIKKPVAKLMKDCERKLFLNPVQAKKYGVIDHVIEWKK